MSSREYKTWHQQGLGIADFAIGLWWPHWQELNTHNSPKLDTLRYRYARWLMLHGPTSPMTFSLPWCLVFCLILKAVSEKIPPTEITTKWTGNHAKAQYGGFYQIVHWKLSWKGRERVVVCWTQRGSSQGVENKGRNQHKKSAIICKKIGSLPCILSFFFLFLFFKKIDLRFLKWNTQCRLRVK